MVMRVDERLEREMVRMVARALRRHGTELHRDTIASMVRDQMPEVLRGPSPRTILDAHPDAFRQMTPGVYGLVSADFKPQPSAGADAFARYGWQLLRHEFDEEAAEQSFEDCLEKDILNVSGHFGIAHAYLRQGHPEKATAVVEWLLRARPQDLAAHRLAAQCYLRLGKWDRAADEWHRIVRESPSDFQAHLRLAVAARESYNTPLAREALEGALDIDSSSVEALLLMAQVEFDDSKVEEAADFVRRAMDVDEDYVRQHCPGALLDLWSGDADS